MGAAWIFLVGITCAMASLTIWRSRVGAVAVGRLVQRKHGYAPAFVMTDGANLISRQRLLRHRFLWRWIFRCRNRSCEETRDPDTQTDDLLRVHRLTLPCSSYFSY